MGLRFKSENKLDFSEIKPGAEVRCTKIDGVLYLSVRDLIMVVCKKDGNQGMEVWRRMHFETIFDLTKDIKPFKFSGRGQQFQPLLSVRAAMILTSFLPGEQAKDKRTQVINMMKSYLGETQEHPPLKKQKLTPTSYVYLLHSDAFPDYVKIGRANDIKRRLIGINCSMPERPYQLVTYFATENSVRDEAEAHRHFAKYRTIREFFKIKKEDVIPYFLAKQNRLVEETEVNNEEEESSNSEESD